MPEITTQEELRELDQRIAREIMKWPLEPYGLHNGNHAWLNDPTNYPHAEIADDPPPHTGVLLWRDPQVNGVYWSPSTKIEAAMEVVEKMWQLGWQIEMVNCFEAEKPVADKSQVWYVRFINIENDMNNWSHEAKSLPEAICRAALKALEHKESE